MRKPAKSITVEGKPSAIIYARVSSKEQEKEGFSIQAQLKSLEAYAAEHGYHIEERYVDVETAKKEGRGHFEEMVAFLKKKKAVSNGNAKRYILLVEKTDRLYRNIKDWVTIEELGVDIHFVKENVILSPESHSSEKFMHGIKVLMAKNYIDNLSEETKKGMIEKAEQGIYPSQAPLGYKNIVGESGKKIIVQDPDMAPLVLLLFEMYATGKYSLSEVTEQAASDGLCNRKSHKKLSKSTVHKTLSKPIYYGDVLWRGEYYRGTHKPIITRALFDKVQEVLTGSGHQKPRPQKHHWAFQGLIFCGHCGCAMVAERHKGKYVYYHCTGNRGICPKQYIREEEIDRQFLSSLKKLQMDDEIIQWVVKALKHSHDDEKTYHAGRVSNLEKQYRLLQERLDSMYIDKLDGKIAVDLFNRKNNEWRKEQSDILRSLESHQAANRIYIEEGVQMLELAQHAVLHYENQNMLEKREVLNFVYSNSTWKDGQLFPNFRKPFDSLVVANEASKKEQGTLREKSALRSVWLPRQDLNLRHGD